MGKTVSKEVYKRRAIHVLVLGMRYAGKTSIIYKIKLGEIDTVFPTAGLDMQIMSDNENMRIVSWDSGVRANTRQQLRLDYRRMHAVVFVVDSTSKDVNDETKEYLFDLLKEGLDGVPLLVMANKQDEPNARSKEVITEELELSKITNRQWNIVSCSAVNGDGLQEGLDWLTSVVTGKMIKKDITESLKTSVKDVTKATTQMQEKTHHYGFGKIKSSLQWILSGCKG